MKIRIKGNSLRIRLSKTEVAIFARDGYVAEKTEFNNGSFIYAIKSSDDESLSAGFTNGNMTLFVPSQLLQQWASSNMVGLQHHMPLNNGNQLFLLIEKDFKCIDAGVTEDQSDYFENPLKAC